MGVTRNSFWVLKLFIFVCFSTGSVSAHNIVLVKKKQSRCQGVVCATKVRILFKDKFVVASFFVHYTEE